MGKNAKILHQFIGGLKQDLDDNAEKNDSYQKGINGRLYSKNGVLSYSSVQGTVEVYNNDQIVKYLGYWSFIDSLIIFVKHLKGGGPILGPKYEDEDIDILSSEYFEINIPFGSTEISFLADIHSNTTKETITIPVQQPDPNAGDDYDQDLTCDSEENETINYTDYYSEFPNSSDKACSFELIDQIPINNEDFEDAIYLITKNDDGIFFGEMKYLGNLNWDPNRKIVTYGLHENNFFLRVYFTDYLNSFRVVNLKDSKLAIRTASEFDVFQGGANLSPQIHEIEIGGQIKAGTVFYSYRLISENGQVTIFAPPSRGLIIEENSDDIFFRGGDVDETTSKKVIIQCNVPDFAGFQEIEAVAIEYAAKDVITAIRNLGIKDVNEVNYFEHVGTEADLSDDINASDIFERISNWKYCSDIESKGNVLFASAIRNEPLPSEILNIGKDFLLHSWDAAGNTHDCLINPEPWTFRYFDPANTDEYYYVNKKRYNSLQVFGSYLVRLHNKITGDEYETVFILTGNEYQIQTKEIFDWLDVVKDDIDFTTKFPNLLFRYENQNLFFDPIVDTTPTDISNYILKFSHKQVIQDIDEEIILINLTIGTSNLTYGGVSLGYNRGNGIRVSFNTEKDELIKRKATDFYSTDPVLIDTKAPSLKKSFVKGEIYRMGITFFDLKGAELFVIPMGDIMIPKFGESQKIFTQSSGEVITLSIKYRNSLEDDGKLWAERVIMNINVRLSCEVMQNVSMYQIMYVPRTENNRTILCQGISAPLERCNKFSDPRRISIPDNVTNKWNLPFQGGPSYDHWGLLQYDIDPYAEDDLKSEGKRITTHRALFYFDSPDIIYNKISSNLIKSAQVERIARLNTDYEKGRMRDGEISGEGNSLPRFSRMMRLLDISGEESDGIPETVNLSIFSKETEGLSETLTIEHAEELKQGQIIAGNSFGISQEISNFALTFRTQNFFYTDRARRYEDCEIESGAKYEWFNVAGHSQGYKTVVIKTEKNAFTDSFIGNSYWKVDGLKDYQGLYTRGTHALINIIIGNRETIYGGRTENAYSRNIYKPLSETIPVVKTSTMVQQFFIEGDIYVTLHIRLKNDLNNKNEDAGNKHDLNDGQCAGQITRTTGSGAWMYAYVVETEVEPRLVSELGPHVISKPHDFEKPYDEFINEAYFQEYIKNSIPQPFRFRDDPNLFNIISSSKTKLTGEFIDAWTIFPANNFYELEKDKGAILNLAKNINDIYAIQKEQTSKLITDPRTMVPTADGEISIQQSGTGGPIADHDIISNYGTAIRRATIPNDFGFEFIDERRFEFIKIERPLLLPNLLGFFLRNLFKEDPILNTEGYYDDQHKETNILIKSALSSIMLSYSQAFEVFNGIIEYNNSIYMQFNDDILVPKNDTLPFNGGTRPNESSLHLLNEGNQLNFFGDQKTMKIAVTSHLKPSEVLIFKHWAADLNIDYAIKEINIETSLGDTRIVQGTHHRYRIREGIHTVPLKNRTDVRDLRGKWMSLEVELESLNNAKIDIFSFINFVRNSYL